MKLESADIAVVDNNGNAIYFEVFIFPRQLSCSTPIMPDSKPQQYLRNPLMQKEKNVNYTSLKWAIIYFSLVKKYSVVAMTKQTEHITNAASNASGPREASG